MRVSRTSEQEVARVELGEADVRRGSASLGAEVEHQVVAVARCAASAKLVEVVEAARSDEVDDVVASRIEVDDAVVAARRRRSVSSPAPPASWSLPRAAVEHGRRRRCRTAGRCRGRRRASSSPPPPSRLSLPPSPNRRSLPSSPRACRCRRRRGSSSLPRSPAMVSLPLPPSSTSLPSPPRITSLPAPPSIVSAPSPPSMSSSPASPSMVSLPCAAVDHGLPPRRPKMRSSPSRPTDQVVDAGAEQMSLPSVADRSRHALVARAWRRRRRTRRDACADARAAELARIAAPVRPAAARPQSSTSTAA